MVGCPNGIVAILKRDQPSLITIHCLAHHLELALKDVAKKNKLYDKTTNKPPHDKVACAPNKDSDQPGHSPSLNNLRCPHEDSLGP